MQLQIVAAFFYQCLLRHNQFSTYEVELNGGVVKFLSML